jgi:hypothetical protein
MIVSLVLHRLDASNAYLLTHGFKFALTRSSRAREVPSSRRSLVLDLIDGTGPLTL